MPLVLIVIFGIGFIGGVFRIPRMLFPRGDFQLETMVIHQAPYVGVQSAYTDFYINTYSGTIQKDSIAWKGTPPAVYATGSESDNGSYQWIVINQTDQTLRMNLRWHYYYLRNNDMWEEIAWQEGHEMDEAPILIDPNSCSDPISLLNFHYDAFEKKTDTEKLSKGTYRIVAYIETVLTDNLSPTPSNVPDQSYYSPDQTEHNKEWWSITYDISV